MNGRILLVRHGETKLNAKSSGDSTERIRGWADVPLDEAGTKAAQELGKSLSKMKIDKIYSSPLIRAYQTALDIGKYQHLVPVKTMALMPWHLGDWTGVKVSDIIDKMKKLVAEGNKAAPGGEPFNIFRDRFLSYLSLRMKEAQQDKSTICLVAHTRNCQCAKAWLAAGEPEDCHIDLKTMDDYSNEVAPGSYMEIQV